MSEAKVRFGGGECRVTAGLVVVQNDTGWRQVLSRHDAEQWALVLDGSKPEELAAILREAVVACSRLNAYSRHGDLLGD